LDDRAPGRKTTGKSFKAIASQDWHLRKKPFLDFLNRLSYSKSPFLARNHGVKKF